MVNDKNLNLENFDLCFNNFLNTADWKIHRDAATNLLKIFGCKKRFLEAVKTGECNLAKLLIAMQKASQDLSYSDNDREGMREASRRAADYNERRQYREIMKLADNLVFRHIVESLELQKRADFDKLTDFDLFKMDLFPKEIFFQFFIIESLAKSDKFDWGRDEKIIDQTFIAAGICFAGIYEYIGFYSESKEES